MANNHAPKFSKDNFIPLTSNNVFEDASETTSHLRNINNIGDDNRFKRLKREQANACTTREIHTPVSWVKRSYSSGVVGLHEEIVDFYQTLSPTKEEKEIRSRVIEHIRCTVHALWPQAKFEVFGSFRTGLFLPTSDIDIVLTGQWDHLPLNTLKTAFIKSGIKDEDITIVSTAAVPLVRLVHSMTKVKVDVSFNVRNGVKSAKMIKEFTKLYPALPKLLLVLKQFLVYRGLNEVYYGGMSSYALTIQIISFLQGHHRPRSIVVHNLGMLLIEFFELFGLNFNYDKVALSINDGGSYRPRQNTWGSFLSIVDPLCEGNDITRGSFLMHQVKNAFENAYNTLHKAVTELYDHNRPCSLLRLILDVSPEVFDQRTWLSENYIELLKIFPSQQESDSENSELSETVDACSQRVLYNSHKATADGSNVKNKSRTMYNHSPMESLRTEFENSLEKLCSPRKNVMYTTQEWRSAQNRNRAPFNAKDSGRYKRCTAQLSKNCDMSRQ